MSLSEFIDRLGRWPWALMPWRVDHGTLVVSDIIAFIQAFALALCIFEGPWVIFAGPMAMIAFFFQVLISAGIVVTKLRATWPPVGHAAMYPTPQPIREVSWLKAMRGLLISLALAGVWVAIPHVRSAT
jgi:hypothetical protein